MNPAKLEEKLLLNKGIYMKILVTGATGLLGTDISFVLEKAGNSVIKACHSERGKGYIAADITTEEGILKLDSEHWNFVIHTSAWKDPDKCEGMEKETYRINVWSSEKIAELSLKRKAKMLFISTDYVFAGDNSPYQETSKKNPINYYGETKSLAEEKILKILPDACILRVPILYGIRAGLKASDLLNASINKIYSNEEAMIDNYIARYPTYTGDVAEAVYFLLRNDFNGIYHFSGQDKMTKYSILKEIGKILNIKTDHIKPNNNIPESKAKRPVDGHLDISKIISAGFHLPMTFNERLEEIINNNHELFYR